MQSMSALYFSLLAAGLLHNFFHFMTVLSFHNVSKLPAFHLWDPCFLSPSFPSSKTTKKTKTLNVVVKKRQCFFKEHFNFT